VNLEICRLSSSKVLVEVGFAYLVGVGFAYLPAQSFGSAHRDSVCVRVFIEVSVRACVGVPLSPP